MSQNLSFTDDLEKVNLSRGLLPIPTSALFFSLPTIQALGMTAMQRHLLKEPGDDSLLPQPEIFLVSRSSTFCFELKALVNPEN